MTKPKWKTQYSENEIYYTEPGEKTKITYTPEITKLGNLELKETGRLNTYEEIQSHKDSVDINKIIEAFENGDENAFMRRQGYFGDFVEVPKTYADLLNKVIKAEQLFLNLPVEERARYDHSVEKFLVSIDNERYKITQQDFPAAPKKEEENNGQE